MSEEPLKRWFWMAEALLHPWAALRHWLWCWRERVRWWAWGRWHPRPEGVLASCPRCHVVWLVPGAQRQFRCKRCGAVAESVSRAP